MIMIIIFIYIYIHIHTQYSYIRRQQKKHDAIIIRSFFDPPPGRAQDGPAPGPQRRGRGRGATPGALGAQDLQHPLGALHALAAAQGTARVTGPQTTNKKGVKPEVKFLGVLPVIIKYT